MKSTKKILGASAALGLAVALSAGSTFAWFATGGNKEVSVNSFEIQATTTAPETANLQIGVATSGTTLLGSGYKFSKTVDKATMENLIETGFQLKPLTVKTVENGAGEQKTYDVVLSSTGEPTFYTAGGFGANDYDDANKVDSKTTPKQAGYLRFNLAFKSEGAPMNIYLEDTSAVTPVNGKTPKGVKIKRSYTDNVSSKTLIDKIYSDKQFGEGYYTSSDTTRPLYEDSQQKNPFTDTTAQTADMYLFARAANASRVMFVTPGATYTPKVWSPNEAKHNGGGVDYYADIQDSDYDYGVVGQEVKKYAGFYASNLAAAYNLFVQNGSNVSLSDLPKQKAYSQILFDSVQKTDSPDGSEYSGYKNSVFAQTTQGILDTSDNNYYIDGGKKYQVPNGDDYYAIVEVYIWLEGTDGDCFESIVNDAMSVVFNFRGEKPNESEA